MSSATPVKDTNDLEVPLQFIDQIPLTVTTRKKHRSGNRCSSPILLLYSPNEEVKLHVENTCDEVDNAQDDDEDDDIIVYSTRKAISNIVITDSPYSLTRPTNDDSPLVPPTTLRRLKKGVVVSSPVSTAQANGPPASSPEVSISIQDLKSKQIQDELDEEDSGDDDSEYDYNDGFIVRDDDDDSSGDERSPSRLDEFHDNPTSDENDEEEQGDSDDDEFENTNLTKNTRDSLVNSLFQEYNERVFSSKLPLSMIVEWSPRLRKTAGVTLLTRKHDYFSASLMYDAKIQLSVKVLDTPHKLATTLLHEMCHAAAWLIDHVSKPPHGSAFQSWARIATKEYPKRRVTTCHSFKIHYKYQFQCKLCTHLYGRHSKSIDVQSQRCGKCKGELVFLGTFKPDGTKSKSGVPAPATEKKPKNAYQVFADSLRKELKEKNPNLKPQQVMSEIAKAWTAKKNEGKENIQREKNDVTPIDLTNEFESLKI
jgi:predicted SprT family Zn-dependent metalloprotease